MTNFNNPEIVMKPDDVVYLRGLAGRALAKYGGEVIDRDGREHRDSSQMRSGAIYYKYKGESPVTFRGFLAEIRPDSYLFVNLDDKGQVVQVLARHLDYVNINFEREQEER